jgi:phage gp16-like protein
MNQAKRVQLVQVARKALGLDEEAYRAILRDYGGVDSATALDDRGFGMVMDRFRYLGFVSDKRKAAFRPNDRIGMASAAQVTLIRELWAKLSRDGSEAALNKWISRFGVSALRFADADRARRIVGALKAWERRKVIQSLDD